MVPTQSAMCGTGATCWRIAQPTATILYFGRSSTSCFELCTTEPEIPKASAWKNLSTTLGHDQPNRRSKSQSVKAQTADHTASGAVEVYPASFQQRRHRGAVIQHPEEFLSRCLTPRLTAPNNPPALCRFFSRLQSSKGRPKKYE